jgi:hypothetical protein
MSDEDLDLDTDDLKRRMEGAMASLKQEFLSLRTGRAAASMLEPVMVDAYGTQTPINQVGTVNVPEPRMLTVNIWDKSLVNKAEKALRESGLGINPVVDGTIIRLPIPELNEERRRELTKVAAKPTIRLQQPCFKSGSRTNARRKRRTIPLYSKRNCPHGSQHFVSAMAQRRGRWNSPPCARRGLAKCAARRSAKSTLRRRFGRSPQPA